MPKGHHNRKVVTHRKPMDIWAVLTADGFIGVIKAPHGRVPAAVDGHQITTRHKLGAVTKPKQAYRKFTHWVDVTTTNDTLIGGGFLENLGNGGLKGFFYQGVGTQGAGKLISTKGQGLKSDPLAVAFGAIALLPIVAATGIPAAGAAALVGGGAVAESAAAGGAAEGEAAAAGAGGVGLGTLAAGAGAAGLAGLFTNVGWWKGLGMVIIGAILGILSIREFSPG